MAVRSGTKGQVLTPALGPLTGPPDAVEAAVTLLHDGLAALAALPADLAPAERAAHETAVTHLIQTLRSGPLHPDPPPLQMDDRRLTRLIELAGPLHTAELLMHLDQDLTRVAQDLAKAVQTSDLGIIRAQTHILITLAGSVGAIGLEEDARILNQIANEASALIPPAAAEPVRQGLDQLCQIISTRRAAYWAGH